MKAQETTYQQLVQGEKQFQVPLYQRTYGWTGRQLEQLWADICDQADDLAEGATVGSHFIGSVVLAPSPQLQASGVQRWLVVDGQQRLTTLMVAMCALRDHVGASDPRQFERLNDLYLLNKWQSGEQRYRLLPTKADRAAYIACLEATPYAGGPHPIGEAYRFFRQALVRADDPADEHDIERIETVIRERLVLVEVTAGQDDNVHRIFESLNNTGLNLTQADLLRNYLFMLLPVTGDEVYEAHWLPMQERLTPTQLEDLIFYDLILRGAERVRRTELYRVQQERLEPSAGDEAAIRAAITELTRRARYLERIVHPDREPDLELRRAFARLRTWKAEATYPVLLALLERLDGGDVDVAEVREAVGCLESFLVRRMLCRVPGTSLNRIMASVTGEMREANPLVDGLRRSLSRARWFWPGDDELRTSIRTQPFYWQGRAEQRMVVLRRLEEAFPSHERADLANAQLTIEHVMPQTPSPEWLEALEGDTEGDESVEELHGRLVHTLGNLTLTGYNAALSNHPFQRKQDLLATSNLEMNRPIARAERWGKAEILERAEDLADKCVALWPGPVGRVRDAGRDWAPLHDLLAALPPATWTTYGAVAEVVGSHAVPIGQHLATTPVLNAHRVLTAGGRVATQFRWPDPDDHRQPQDVLQAEGVRFDEHGVADATQRLAAADLATLVGLDADDEEDSDASLPARHDRFFAQLDERHPAELVARVRRVIGIWRDLGGEVAFGHGAETSLQLRLVRRDRGWRRDRVVLAILYPGYGAVEIQFRGLASSAPFDTFEHRDALRRHFNDVAGVALPTARLSLRPSFKLGLLNDDTAIDQFAVVLGWFVDQCDATPSAGSAGAVAGSEPSQG